jgi:hypothetical protein
LCAEAPACGAEAGFRAQACKRESSKGVTEKICLPLEFIPVKTGKGMTNRVGMLNFLW